MNTLSKEEILNQLNCKGKFNVKKYKCFEAMSKYAEQQSMAFVEWIHNNNIPFYGYRGQDIWEIIKPLKQGEKQEYISTKDLYQLFINQQKL